MANEQALNVRLNIDLIDYDDGSVLVPEGTTFEWNDESMEQTIDGALYWVEDFEVDVV